MERQKRGEKDEAETILKEQGKRSRGGLEMGAKGARRARFRFPKRKQRRAIPTGLVGGPGRGGTRYHHHRGGRRNGSEQREAVRPKSLNGGGEGEERNRLNGAVPVQKNQ